MSETSAAVPRDHLADMTRERDAWRASTFKCLFLFFAINGSMIAAPHIERAWLAWRAEPRPVSVQVPCPPLTRGNPDGWASGMIPAGPVTMPYAAPRCDSAPAGMPCFLDAGGTP